MKIYLCIPISEEHNRVDIVDHVESLFPADHVYWWIPGTKYRVSDMIGRADVVLFHFNQNQFKVHSSTLTSGIMKELCYVHDHNVPHFGLYKNVTTDEFKIYDLTMKVEINRNGHAISIRFAELLGGSTSNAYSTIALISQEHRQRAQSGWLTNDELDTQDEWWW